MPVQSLLAMRGCAQSLNLGCTREAHLYYTRRYPEAMRKGLRIILSVNTVKLSVPSGGPSFRSWNRQCKQQKVGIEDVPDECDLRNKRCHTRVKPFKCAEHNYAFGRTAQFTSVVTMNAKRRTMRTKRRITRSVEISGIPAVN